jgi:HSP90 family molecular chaperone
VAKSIYTDSEVFVRELISNASDALEKQRMKELKGSVGGDQLFVNIITNEKERTLTIFDTGIGMNKQEVCDNLGTIARSGSQEFVKQLEKSGDATDSIIGQFGVGFYSTFIVSDHVEVISKKDNEKAVRWVSDGTGEYEV